MSLRPVSKRLHFGYWRDGEGTEDQEEHFLRICTVKPVAQDHILIPDTPFYLNEVPELCALFVTTLINTTDIHTDHQLIITPFYDQIRRFLAEGKET